jgi:hypothetical protein
LLCLACSADAEIYDELLSVFSFWLHGSWAVIELAMKVIRLAVMLCEVRQQALSFGAFGGDL